MQLRVGLYYYNTYRWQFSCHLYAL